MARSIVITDNDYQLDIAITNTSPTSASSSYSINKANITNLDLIDDLDTVAIWENNHKRPIHKIDSTVVSTPVVANATALYNWLEAAMNNIPSNGVYAKAGTFVDGDLVDGAATWILTITHPYSTTDVSLTIKDATNVATGAAYTVVDDSTVTVDFGGTIGAGTWSYLLVAKV